jgi:hypothetical protein
MSATPLPVATSNSRTRAWRRLPRLAAPAFWISAVALSAWLLARSWQRWVDPLIDFGTQLYVPWRITLGEHLGRDISHPYGMLSSYFNAGLFRLFGVSLQTLVAANVVIFAAIFTCLHFLLRRAFGFAPAALATLAGIAIFGFGNYTGINNYTYAAPYSHEATHGLLLLLLLALCLNRAWLRPRPSGLASGLLLGLIALAKVEILFAACGAVACFVVARIIFQRAAPSIFPWLGKTAAIAAGVVFAAWVMLAVATDARHAAIAVLSGSLSPWLYSAYATSGQSRMFLGTDEPLRHAAQLLYAGGLAAAAIWGVSSAIGWSLGVARRGWMLLGLVPVGLWLAAAWWVPPLEGITAIADAFPVLLALAAVLIFFRQLERREATLTSRTFAQLLLLVLAVTLMTRMALAPRVFHFGFIQALVAALWIMAFYVGEWPRFLATSTAGRRAIGLSLAAVLIMIAGGLMRISQIRHGMKTLPIGTGGDQFLGYAAKDMVGHHQVELVRDYLATHSTPSSTLLVIPEGIMLNYLTRQKNPLRIVNLQPATMRVNERPVLADLIAKPPDRVLFISRMVGDDPIKPFGADDEHGKPILEWVAANYLIEAKAGGDPFKTFTPENSGWILMKRKLPAH